MAALAVLVRAAAGLLATQLLRGPSAEAARVMAPSDGGELAPEEGALPASLVQGGAGLERAAAELNSSGVRAADSVSFCYETDAAPGSCWSSRPSAAPACTVDSAQNTCRCPDEDCIVDQMGEDTPSLGRCLTATVYVFQGSDGKREAYCSDMQKEDQWKAKHIVKLPSDPPAANGKPWAQCWHPNTWHEGKCQRTARYLGETCWGGRVTGGKCATADGCSTACYKGTCTPSDYARERPSCQCAKIGWNFLVICSAADDKCGGHACVLNEGDGNRYCDYSSSQNW